MAECKGDNEMNVIELKKDDVIRFQIDAGDFAYDIKAIVLNVYSHFDQKHSWKAEVETEDGVKMTINDTYDFCKVREPFSHKVDMVSKPSHYHSNDGIDLIEFCRQQFTEEEFRGAMKFTQMRYALRTGRKENDLQDQRKLGEYANRFVGALKNDN